MRAKAADCHHSEISSPLPERWFPTNTAGLGDLLMVPCPLPSACCGGRPHPSLTVTLEPRAVSQLCCMASRVAFTERLVHAWPLFQLFPFRLFNLFNCLVGPGAQSLTIFWRKERRHRAREVTSACLRRRSVTGGACGRRRRGGVRRKADTDLGHADTAEDAPRWLLTAQPFFLLNNFHVD